jgi:hypothetical protein
MKLAQAKASFIEEQKQGDAKRGFAESNKAGAAFDSLELLYDYFSNISLDEITAARLREFLSRWYVEEAATGSTSQNPSMDLPNAQTVISTLSEFFRWTGETATNQLKKESRSEKQTPAPLSGAVAQERLAVLKSLRETLPRAIEITKALSRHLAERPGAFAFPEFLTSFEEGGQSDYDIGGLPGKVSAMEGYFRILRVDGVEVLAEEVIAEKPVWPIIFPEEVARLLSAGYLINLELVCLENHWQIVNCGFAYPPGTEM